MVKYYYHPQQLTLLKHNSVLSCTSWDTADIFILLKFTKSNKSRNHYLNITLSPLDFIQVEIDLSSIRMMTLKNGHTRLFEFPGMKVVSHCEANDVIWLNYIFFMCIYFSESWKARSQSWATKTQNMDASRFSLKLDARSGHRDAEINVIFSFKVSVDFFFWRNFHSNNNILCILCARP